MFAKIQKMLKNRKGFTLIELIVVIAILGILAAIAIPNISGIRDKAVQAKTDTNKEIAERAAAMWLAEHGKPSSSAKEITSSSNDLNDYLKEWPEGVTKITIGTDGSIKVE